MSIRGHADVVVVAAGESRRMGFDKLEAPVRGRPLLAWTLERLAGSPVVDSIVVVTAPDRVGRLRAAPWLPGLVCEVVAGGSRRQESVHAGVEALAAIHGGAADDRVVLVHDAARPLVTADLVAAVAAAAAEHGAAIPVVPVAETVKQLGADGRIVGTLDRRNFAVAQTPQGARLGLLRAAFARFPPGGTTEFTDEASLLEACTIPVHAIPGEPANLKVTVPDDLRQVERALGGGTVRVGIGHDSHPFGPGSPLVLGGVRFDGAPRLHGHSDGDVVLHAVADALLGAAALGDLGRLFPADARTPAGIDSRTMLATVVERLRAVGLRPARVDLVIVGARPRLGGRLADMQAAIAGVLDLAPDAIGVKASTGNLDGSEGAGRGWSAHAVATVEPIR
ncbi:MAG TPA: 2-C-methyl-D-erythritol 4-phosphate cytidylyltransferase [Candidatus Limnocylindrales bacterium]|nr:2-C-methyl-D-erythritol 4-phosphate cytidylyltransferase [Candidatus Limnocylindrales bacterium]